MSTLQIQHYALAHIDRLLRSNGSSLSKFTTMPKPNDWYFDTHVNVLLQDEKSYNVDDMIVERNRLLSIVTDEQMGVYTQIIDVVDFGNDGMFFLYGFGSTGNTYIWSLVCAELRSRGSVVLTVASSGIAALLLPGGRTAHSRFGISLIVHGQTLCEIEVGSHLAELIFHTQLIIWDEAPMMSKHCFETLDRSLREILRSDRLFGGKVVVFGGDFRQILPVITDAGREETVIASLSFSILWKKCIVLKLTKNMRLQRPGMDEKTTAEMSAFSQWILDIALLFIK